MSKIITQIYGIRSLSDAQMVVDIGGDHIGVSYGKIKQTSGMLNFEQAREIFEGIGNQAVKVGLTVSTVIDEIIEMVTVLQPDILHLSGDIRNFSPKDVNELIRIIPSLKIMQAIPANDPDVFRFVKEYEEVSDFFLIDTVSDATNIGATGLTHDLQIDKKIVGSTKVPCIIAGGLSSSNVAEALQIVRPYGVDSFTHTNFNKLKGKNLKDPEKVKAFIDAVRNIEKIN